MGLLARFTRTAPAPPPSHGPAVLELRIHGVANTSPAVALGLTAGQVEQVDGDDLGSFWAPTEAAAAASAKLPADDYRRVPPNVRREAYSWGAMARLSAVPGLGAVSGTLAGVIRALWVLIIPFGLANVAYWSVDLTEKLGTRRGSAAGALVRLFGLVLTLLWVATAATVALWTLAAQCYGPVVATPVPHVQVCAALPSFLDSWARWDAGPRTAVLALCAALAILALGAVGSTGNVRYESRRSITSATGGTSDHTERANEGRWPVLARHGFWAHAKRSGALWLNHLTAAFALLTVVLAWHYLYYGTPACWFGPDFGTHGCLEPSTWQAGGGSVRWAVLVALGGALLLAAALRVAMLRIDPADLAPGTAHEEPPPVNRTPDVVALLASLVVFAVCELCVAGTGALPVQPDLPADRLPSTGTEPFIGLDAVPTVLVAILFLLCVCALGLRGHLPAALWGSLTAVVAAASVAAVWWRHSTLSPVLWGVTVVAGVAVVVASLVANARQPDRRLLGWRGHAPFVFLSMAAGAAMVLSAATVAGVTAWLERPGAPENVALDKDVQASLDAADTLRRPVQVSLTHAVHLAPATAYRDFAVVSVLGLAVLALYVVVMLLRAAALRGIPLPDVPGGSTSADPAVQPARHNAAVAHRAERVAGTLATIFFVAIAASLSLRGLRTVLDESGGPVWTFMTTWSGQAVCLAAGLLFTSVVLAGSKKSLSRPWGLLWDLMCFLPRAAHPFAPPCYAERAVPELRSRIDDWLGGLDVPEEDRAALPPRAVVLSAHSIGAVLAVGAMFARWDARDGTGPTDPRIGLLTYGTQLRTYFGRFFPELLGPAVLGTHASLAPRPWAADPWTLAPPTPRPPGLTVVDSLTGGGSTEVRWRNLWRRSDYIGFPVDDYVGSPVDRAAAEEDLTTYLFSVATHYDYPRAPQYRDQLDALVALLTRDTGLT
ncbi:hypothetical protein ACPPVS_02105 [Cellulomonas sp. McL0617]|uniref:hypothetical protein n=1 Tax=Cellulomonas sp. McL0617 TaxID=3415675 RepID=UPI003CF5F83D